MIFTPEEEKMQKTPYEFQFADENTGKIMKVKKMVAELVGGRKQNRSKEYEYEVRGCGVFENNECRPSERGVRTPAGATTGRISSEVSALKNQNYSSFLKKNEKKN